MTSEERSTWVSALVAIGACVAYVIVMNTRAAGGALVEVPYVRPLLWAVGTTIVASIVGAIALTMTGSAHFWIANALYLSFVVSGLVAAVLKIVVYRRRF